MVEMGRGQRRRRWWLWLIALLLSFIGAYLFLQPRITEVSPAPESTAIPASRPIEIQFNRPMDHNSVEARLTIEPPISGIVNWQQNRLQFQPESGWPQGEIIEVQLRAGASSALSLPLLTGQSWQFQIGQPRVLYLSDRAGPSQLEVRVLNEATSQDLFEAPLGVVDYDLAIAQEALITIEPKEDGTTAIVLRDLEGASQEELHRCGVEVRCRQPALSPGGRWLAWQQQSMGRSETGVLEAGPWQIQLQALGSAATTRQLLVEGEVHSPQWVGENRLAAYSSELEALLIFQFESTDQWQQIGLVDHPLGEQWAWSPEGRFVVFPEVVLLESPTEGVDFYSHLFRVEVDSGLTTDLSGSSRELVEDASPSYSPDGLSLAFARKSLLPSEWTLGRQLWVMGSDGSESRALTNEPNFNHAGIRWHPDGDRLVYVRFDQSRLDAPTQIWWYDFIREEHQLIVEGGFAPRWMP